ncbi:MAG: protein translocase subunit SecF, partial [Candidatus Phosphoribacter sp.]
IATPLLVDLRRGEPALLELEKHATKLQAREAELSRSTPRHTGAQDGPGKQTRARGTATTILADVPAADGQEPDAHELGAPQVDEPQRDALGRPVHKWAATGPRNQPKRPPRSRR